MVAALQCQHVGAFWRLWLYMYCGYVVFYYSVAILSKQVGCNRQSAINYTVVTCHTPLGVLTVYLFRINHFIACPKTSGQKQHTPQTQRSTSAAPQAQRTANDSPEPRSSFPPSPASNTTPDLCLHTTKNSSAYPPPWLESQSPRSPAVAQYRTCKSHTHCSRNATQSSTPA